TLNLKLLIMKNRKLKMIAPLLTLVFAIGGAFATNSFTKVDALAEVDGYIDSPSPCEQRVSCSDINTGIVCTDQFDTQAFAKENPSATTCNVEVYQLEP